MEDLEERFGAFRRLTPNVRKNTREALAQYTVYLYLYLKFYQSFYTKHF